MSNHNFVITISKESRLTLASKLKELSDMYMSAINYPGLKESSELNVNAKAIIDDVKKSVIFEATKTLSMLALSPERGRMRKGEELLEAKRTELESKNAKKLSGLGRPYINKTKFLKEHMDSYTYADYMAEQKRMYVDILDDLVPEDVKYEVNWKSVGDTGSVDNCVFYYCSKSGHGLTATTWFKHQDRMPTLDGMLRSLEAYRSQVSDAIELCEKDEPMPMATAESVLDVLGKCTNRLKEHTIVFEESFHTDNSIPGKPRLKSGYLCSWADLTDPRPSNFPG